MFTATEIAAETPVSLRPFVSVDNMFDDDSNAPLIIRVGETRNIKIAYEKLDGRRADRTGGACL